MDVRLTDEQVMLRDAAVSIASDLATDSVAGLTPDRRREAADAGWAVLVNSGLVGLQVPEELGGGGARLVDAALVAEQLAGRLTGAPFVGAGVWVPSLLAAAGAIDAVQAVVAGRLRLAPVLRRDLSGLASRGEEGVAFDTQGATAGLLFDGSGALATVELGDATRGVDLTRTLRLVAADAAAIDVGVPLGARISPADQVRVDAGALAMVAADLLGVMQRSLDEAVGYVRHRVQFGVPVGSFQAVRHLAASAAVLVEGARSSMWHGAWAADELAPQEALLAARQAKAFCSAAARDVGETTIQLFGGIGLTWEHLAHVRQRRTLLSRRILGDEQAQYAAIADRLLTNPGGA